jgi:hypothetical protein
MKKRLLFTLGCSFTEGDGGYPPEPFFEPEGIPLDGSRRDELHGTEVMQNYRNSYHDYFHNETSWPTQLAKRKGFDKLINIAKCASSTGYNLRSLYDKYWNFDWENYDTTMFIWLTDSIRFSFYSGGVPQTFMCGNPDRPFTLSGRYAKIIQDVDIDPLLEQRHHLRTLEQYCENRGIKLVIMSYWTHEDAMLKDMHKSKHYASQEPGWTPIPFEYGQWTLNSDGIRTGKSETWDSRYHSPICYHPNKEGYSLIVDTIIEQLDKDRPDTLHIENFNNNPELVWDGDPIGFEYADDHRIQFDHEGLTQDEYESYYKHGKLPD